MWGFTQEVFSTCSSSPWTSYRTGSSDSTSRAGVPPTLGAARTCLVAPFFDTRSSASMCGRLLSTVRSSRKRNPSRFVMRARGLQAESVRPVPRMPAAFTGTGAGPCTDSQPTVSSPFRLRPLHRHENGNTTRLPGDCLYCLEFVLPCGAFMALDRGSPACMARSTCRQDSRSFVGIARVCAFWVS